MTGSAPQAAGKEDGVEGEVPQDSQGGGEGSMARGRVVEAAMSDRRATEEEADAKEFSQWPLALGVEDWYVAS